MTDINEAKTYSKEVKPSIKLLKKHGYSFHRAGKGDHELWHNPEKNHKITVNTRSRDANHSKQVQKDINQGPKVKT